MATGTDAEASHRPRRQTLAGCAYKNPTSALLSLFPPTAATFVVPSSTSPLRSAEAMTRLGGARAEHPTHRTAPSSLVVARLCPSIFSKPFAERRAFTKPSTSSSPTPSQAATTMSCSTPILPC